MKKHNSCSSNYAITSSHDTKNQSKIQVECIYLQYQLSNTKKTSKKSKNQTPPNTTKLINASDEKPYFPALARCYSQLSDFYSKMPSTLLPPKEEWIDSDQSLHKMKPFPIIPKKIFRALWNFAPKYLWAAIHPDKRTALELAVILCSLLTQYRKLEEKEEKERPYTRIASSLLIKLFGSGERYIAIVRLLEYGTKKHGKVIERHHSYQVGGHCKGYRFSEHYSDKGLTKFELKTERAKGIYQNYTYERLSKVTNDPIVKHILKTYPRLTLPSKEELVERAKTLIAKKHRTNKGKILRFRGNKGRNHFKKGKYAFVEDDIKLYNLLCHDGFLTPIIGADKSGGRVVDSFTLLPSWIRDMIKINGKSVQQYDYKALHPNIALNLYGSEEEKEKLSGDIHTYLAEKYQIDRKTIKVENLSFFNKRSEQMKKSILWELYAKEAPIMLQNIISEKEEFSSHKVTSQKLFEQEVALMRDVILEIEKRKSSIMDSKYRNCSCIYVYDALYTGGIDISEIMNEVALQKGLLTFV